MSNFLTIFFKKGFHSILSTVLGLTGGSFIVLGLAHFLALPVLYPHAYAFLLIPSSSLMLADGLALITYSAQLKQLLKSVVR